MGPFPSAPGFAPPAQPAAQQYAQPGSPPANQAAGFNPFDPDNFSTGGGGGLFRDRPGMIEYARILLWDYNGKGTGKPSYAIYAPLVGADGSVHEQYWSLGPSSTDFLVPANLDPSHKGPNGQDCYLSIRPITNAERVAKGLPALGSDEECKEKGKIPANSNGGSLLKSLKDNGFPMANMATAGMAALDGGIFYWIGKAIEIGGEKKTRERVDAKGVKHVEQQTTLVIGVGPDGPAIRKLGWDTSKPGYQRDPAKVAAYQAAQAARQAGQAGGGYTQPANGVAGYSAQSYAPPPTPGFAAPPAAPVSNGAAALPPPTQPPQYLAQVAEALLRYMIAPTTGNDGIGPVTTRDQLNAVRTKLSFGSYNNGRPDGLPNDVAGVLAWMNAPASQGDRAAIVQLMNEAALQTRVRGTPIA